LSSQAEEVSGENEETAHHRLVVVSNFGQEVEWDLGHWVSIYVADQ